MYIYIYIHMYIYIYMYTCIYIYTYEEFARLAETRLAQSTSDYLEIS